MRAINLEVEIHSARIFESRCQSFTAQRGPLVHFADLQSSEEEALLIIGEAFLDARTEALLDARRDTVTHRATTRIFEIIYSRITS